MDKEGREYKIYSAESKIGVIMDMREQHLGYRETVRKYWNVLRGQDLNYINTVNMNTKNRKLLIYSMPIRVDMVTAEL